LTAAPTQGHQSERSPKCRKKVYGTDSQAQDRCYYKYATRCYYKYALWQYARVISYNFFDDSVILYNTYCCRWKCYVL